MPTYQSNISIFFDRVFASEEFLLNMKNKFPYTTTFASTNLQFFSPNQDDVFLATASIEKLKKYLDWEIDLEKNYDLLGVVFNAFVVNRVNKNDQVISTEDALACVENFKYKPLNIEHNRENVVGLITGYGFSEFGTDKPLTLEEVKGSKNPFNVVLKGFVWKITNREFAEKLEASSDPSSEDYMKISASWELGFREFKIVKGSKNLVECEELPIESLDEAKAFLRHFGGPGKDKNGNPIYLQIVGEVLPLGIGFTINPAAEVKGILTQSGNEKDEKEIKSSKNFNLEDKNEKNISQNEKTNVLKNTEQQKLLAMLIKSLSDIKDENISEITASDVSLFIENELKKASEKWSAEKAEAEAAIEKARKNEEALRLELEAAKKEVEETRAEIQKIKSELEAKKIEDDFQLRMASLDEEYELSDEDREVIASQIYGMDSESFDSWMKSFSVLAKEKSKAFKAEILKKNQEKSNKKSEDKLGDYEDNEKRATASENILDDLKEKKGSNIPNNGVDPKKPSLREMFAKAFNKEKVRIIK